MKRDYRRYLVLFNDHAGDGIVCKSSVHIEDEGGEGQHSMVKLEVRVEDPV